jgi:hypothetical protein
MKILLGDFNAKVVLEDQDGSVIGNCGLHEERNGLAYLLTELNPS